MLRERNPYYAYQRLSQLRKDVILAAKKDKAHPQVMSLQNAKMIFRITNHFTPAHILQIGVGCGIATASMMAANSRAHIQLYESRPDRFDRAQYALKPFMSTITRHEQLSDAIEHYRLSLSENDLPFVLVNDLPNDSDFDTLRELLFYLIAGNVVIVMRNISRVQRLKLLWLKCKKQASYGQTFTNEKLAIIVANPKLQREDFLLWF